MQPDGGQDAGHWKEADTARGVGHTRCRQHSGQCHHEQPNQDEEVVWAPPPEKRDAQTYQEEDASDGIEKGASGRVLPPVGVG